MRPKANTGSELRLPRYCRIFCLTLLIRNICNTVQAAHQGKEITDTGVVRLRKMSKFPLVTRSSTEPSECHQSVHMTCCLFIAQMTR